MGKVIDLNMIDNPLLGLIRYYKVYGSDIIKFLFLYMVGKTFLLFEDYKTSSAFLFGILIFFLYGKPC